MELSSRDPTRDGRAALLLACLSACGPGGDRLDARGDVGEWQVASEPLLTVGSVDGPPETLLSRVADAVLLPDGGVAVADGGSSTIRIFDADGALRETLGSAGEGPGEFGTVLTLALFPPDTLVAWDPDLARLTRFPTDRGAPARTLPIRAPGGSVEGWYGRFPDGSLAVGWIRPEPRGTAAVTADVMELGRVPPGAEEARVLVRTPGMRRVAFERSGGARSTMPGPFSPHLIAVVVGDALFYTDGLGPALEVMGSDGGRREPLVHGLVAPAVAVARAGLVRALAETHAGTPAALGEEDLDAVDDVSPLDTVPAVSDLLADGHGRIWVKRYDPGMDSHWRLRQRSGGVWVVLEPGGPIVARARVPDGFRPLDVRNDRVAGLVRDALGVERVEVRALLVP